MHTKRQNEVYVRNFIFGVEDSLVSTVGFVSGVAVAGFGKQNVFLAGLVLIFVEAFSMGVGSYLSEDSAEEFIDHKKSGSRSSVIGALIMFFSYLFFGLIPLSPYVLLSVKDGLILSILFALVALFLLGALSARYFHRSWLKHGLKMLIVGGLAVMAGIIVGQVAV